MTDQPLSLRCERIKPGVPNLNNRVYTREILEQMAQQINERSVEARMLGRLGTDFEPPKLIDATHMVIAASVDDDGLLATLEVLDTPHGKALQEVLDSGSKLEVVPAGFGSLQATQREGKTVQVVQDDYQILSLDILPVEPEDQ